MIETGRFTIYQWNGKDLFLSTVDGRFLVLSRQELPQEVVEKIQVGRQVTVSDRGKIAMVPSPEEILDAVLGKIAVTPSPEEILESINGLRSEVRSLRREVEATRRERPAGYSLRLEPISQSSPAVPLQVNVDVITYRRRRGQLLTGIEVLEKSGEFPEALEQMKEDFRAYEKEL